MIDSLIDLIVAAAIVVGVLFMFVATLGIVRFPDFYLRVHAPTKAATLGLFALVFGLTVAIPDVRVAEALLAAVFIGATIPVSAHVLLRGAYRSGLRPSRTRVDEYGPWREAAQLPEAAAEAPPPARKGGPD